MPGISGTNAQFDAAQEVIPRDQSLGNVFVVLKCDKSKLVVAFVVYLQRDHCPNLLLIAS